MNVLLSILLVQSVATSQGSYHLILLPPILYGKAMHLFLVLTTLVLLNNSPTNGFLNQIIKTKKKGRPGLWSEGYSSLIAQLLEF